MSHRRLSFGGRATTPLRDASSCRTTPLRDASSYQNISSTTVRSETPLKDRLTMLEEWRQARATPNNHDAGLESAMKRPRTQENQNDGAPPVPPSSRSVAASTTTASAPGQGPTVLQRFHKRNQLKMLSHQNDESFASSSVTCNVSMCNNNGTMPTIFLDESDDKMSTMSRTSRRRLSTGARRMSVTTMPVNNRSARKSILPNHRFSDQQEGSVDHLSVGAKSGGTRGGSGVGSHNYMNVIETGRSQNATMTLSQLTVESMSDEVAADPSSSQRSYGESSELNIVEGAELRSRIKEMQQRIEQLEKEKMVLSMAKAPLEARFRQKEETWLREQTRMAQEIESLKAAACEVDERFRDLQMKYEAAEEEAKQLRLEVRKVSSSINNHNNHSSLSSSLWSRQLQNDRDVIELKEKLKAAAFDLDTARLEKVSVEKELHAVKMELESIARNFEELQQEYDEISKSTSEQRDAEIQLEVLSTEHIAMSAQLNAVCADLAATKARAEASLEAKEEEHKKVVEQLQFDLSVLKSRAGKNVRAVSKDSPGEEDEAVLKARIEERDRRIAELEAEILRGEEIRRQMHNRIQELRGNIRVFVRTRPFLPSDQQENDPAIDVSLDGESLSIMDARSNSQHSFKFDKVFPPSSGQDLIFQEVADFVQSALDGYQVCLFSYGQTGSGKTHTMQGSGNGAMRGIIPRAVEQILMQAQVMRKQRWEFKLSASFLEIYNEDLKDLLTSLSQDKSVAKNPPKLAIKKNLDGKTYVEGLTEVPIETLNSQEGMARLDALMSVAARARSVASTKMNAQSSRSHSVFKLHIRGYNEDSQAEVHGSLNLCDLAGSERLDRSGANNDAKRLRETQAINKSLSCLGDVFNALAQGAHHVPFRNSKLTYLLQDCLSGDGKTLMFVNLSPTTASSNESLCSLRFAQRVNQVELGKPTKNIQYKR